MSGHSKWATIKRDKGANDSKRGAVFTKIGKQITIAARNGGDPVTNAALYFAMQKGKEANMPNDNINRAIKKGTGEDKSGSEIIEMSYEGYGPGGVALIVDIATDNKNRTGPEVRKLIESTGGTVAEGGAVAWQFEQRGLFVLPFESKEDFDKRQNAKWNDKEVGRKVGSDIYEELELELIDTDGVVDIQKQQGESGEVIEILTSPEAIGTVKKLLEAKSLIISAVEMIKVPKTPMSVDAALRDRINTIIENIEDHEDVQSVWTNMEQN